jgi:hypothetical protein
VMAGVKRERLENGVEMPKYTFWVISLPGIDRRKRELAAQRLILEGSKGSAHAMSWEDAKATLTDWRLYAPPGNLATQTRPKQQTRTMGPPR